MHLPGFARRSYLATFAIALLVVVLLVGVGGAYASVQTAEHLGEQARAEFTSVAEQITKNLGTGRRSGP